ncbi:UDP-N-acetylmuramoylalanine--D-glutamate ligase [bacterium HR35]|nr:UDP-N-acetylmuramoylalanine--D-glutamate ligase [bacterium HR35]
MKNSYSLKNKKVLILGLGVLGGGLATAKWFFKKGAKLRVTDLKTKKELKKSIDKLNKFINSSSILSQYKSLSKENIRVNPRNNYPRKSVVRYILGKHRKEDIDWADIIAVNPGVSYKNELVKYALSKNKEVVNDCYLFFKYAKGDIIAITGTRGKTTTTTWIYELLKNADFRRFDADLRRLNKKNILLGGNQPDKGLLKILDKTKENSVSVLELSSFQLEFYTQNLKAPKIAIITCLLRDHLNRYENMEEYAKAKANIFINQKKDDYLILNYDNQWTKFFLKLKPKSQVYFVSLKPLPKNLKGAFIKNNNLIIRDEKDIEIFDTQTNADITYFREIYGEHNVYNLLFAVLAVYLYLKDKSLNIEKFKKYLQKQIFKLKTPPFRQEIVYQNKNLIIVNDSAATTPDATIAAIRRFGQNLILITGGTDKNLDFKELAKEIKNKIKPENLFLLNGSATKKLIDELKKLKYPIKEENIFEDLKKIVFRILNQYKSYFHLYNNQRLSVYKKRISVYPFNNPYESVVILFSPASASFEKFKNEFDRGKKFNKYIRQFCQV